MRTPEEDAVARSIIQLMRGVLYQESDEEVWRTLQQHRAPVRDHFTAIGVDVVVDENEGYAYLRAQEEPEEEPLPRLVRRRSLSFHDSLLLVLLRKRMVEFEARGDEGKLVLDREEIVDMMLIFLADSSDEARILRNVDTSIDRVEKMGFLRRLRGRSEAWEVQRILKAYVDAQTLSDFSAKLEEYARALKEEA